MKNYETLCGLLRPCKAQNLIRVGSIYDGGYVLPLDAVLRADCLISFGVSTNYDFEKDILKRNADCRIFMYDPFIGPFEDFKRLINRISKNGSPQIKKLPAINPEYVPEKNSIFFQIIRRLVHWFYFYSFTFKPGVTYKKLGLREYSDGSFISFPELLRNDEIKTKKSIILKIDIEGDEYRIYEDIISHVDNVTTILLEVHSICNHCDVLSDIITRLKLKKFFVTHVHGNNSDQLIEGSTIPNTLEISFSRSDFCSPELFSDFSYPVPGLDNPCNPGYIDYQLDWI